MPSYVCIIFGKGRTALTVEAFDAPDERLAVAQALALARVNSQAFGYELWDGGHKVSNFFAREPLAHALPRPAAGAESTGGE